ncbi:MAG: phosphatase 2C-like domain-containing protein [Monoraphidium minutum]|nr:MAG: phosphatase 2C-like domain-containing protein [Monoraphidium minutum]
MPCSINRLSWQRLGRTYLYVRAGALPGCGAGVRLDPGRPHRSTIMADEQQLIEPPLKRQRGEDEQRDDLAAAAPAGGTGAGGAAPPPGAAGAGAAAMPQQAQEQERPSGADAAAPPQQQRQAGLPHTPIAFACSEDKGCRQTHEDVWVAEGDARGSGRRDGTGGGGGGEAPLRVSFFAVFDGHGGRGCAAYAAENLHAAALRVGLVAPEAAAGAAPLDVKRVRQAVSEAFKSTDAELCKLCEAKGWQDGAAAVVAWLLGDLVVVANAGDAKAVLAREPADKDKAAGQAGPRALTLTKEHLAIHTAERQRIAAAGGFVSKDGRLNGRIQVSRSFGDAQFKRRGATAAPDMQARPCRGRARAGVFTLTPRDLFLLLACDGFWGVFDPQDAVAAARQLLAEGRDAKAVTNRLVNMAVRERRCKDNCTVMLIVFGGGGGGSAEDLAAAAADGGAAAAAHFQGWAAPTGGGPVFGHVLAFEGPLPAAASAGPSSDGGAALRLPTNFRASRAVRHGTWQHGGTDFSSGVASQRLPLRGAQKGGGAGSRSGPCSRPASPAAAQQAPGAAPRAPPPRPASSLAAARGAGGWRGGGAAGEWAAAGAGERPELDGDEAGAAGSTGVWSAYHGGGGGVDVGATGGAAAPSQRRDGWFTTESVEQLRIDRDRARAAAGGGAFAPRPGAMHAKRSARIAGGGARRLMGGGGVGSGSGSGKAFLSGEPGLRDNVDGIRAAAHTGVWTAADTAEQHWPAATAALGAGTRTWASDAAAWREPAAVSPEAEAEALAAAAAARAELAPAQHPPRWWEAAPGLVPLVAALLCSERGGDLAAAAAGGARWQTLGVLGATLARLQPGSAASGGGGAAAPAWVAAAAGGGGDSGCGCGGLAKLLHVQIHDLEPGGARRKTQPEFEAPSQNGAAPAAARGGVCDGEACGASVAGEDASWRRFPLPEELCHAAWVGELAGRLLAARQLQLEAEAAAVGAAGAAAAAEVGCGVAAAAMGLVAVGAPVAG